MRDLQMGMIGLLNPSFAARMMESHAANEKYIFDKMKKEKKVMKWDEDRTKFATRLVLDGGSYNPHPLFDTTPLSSGNNRPTRLGLKEAEAKNQAVFCPEAPFAYVNRILPAGIWLNLNQGYNRKGQVAFTTSVTVPILFEILASGESETWMSFTPNEMITQRPGVRMAKGRVVVGGLGLGWFLQKVVAKPTVTEVVLVEKNKGLLNWLRPVIEARLTDPKKVKWVCADVYEFMAKDVPANPDTTRYLLDIWPSYGASDSKFDQFKQKLGDRLWGWGQYSEPMRRLW